MNTKLCSNCRQPNANQDSFCINCGAQIISNQKRLFGWKVSTAAFALIVSICALFAFGSTATETTQTQNLTAAPVQLAAFGSTPHEQTKEITVYVTETGHKYHRGSCRYLGKSKIAISLKNAKQDYEPCSVCDPPR